MREALRQVLEQQLAGREPLSHAGLAYESWALPRPESGAPEQAQKRWSDWLSWVSSFQAPEEVHDVAVRRWRGLLETEPHTRCLVFESRSRLLVGHGNPSGTEVGLALHHTWGVPVLPGSSLKGLMAHYVQAVYGPGDPSHPEPERAPYGGVRWEGNRMKGPPGEVYRLLFGSPETDERGPEAPGASEGKIVFYDGLWLPPTQGGTAETPLVRDVLTVHQFEYYQGKGAWPNDYDSPNPVAFLTVAPGSRFLVALGVVPGTERAGELLALAERFLAEALREWGVGGKGSAGYGRLERVAAAPARTPPPSPVLSELGTWLEGQKAQGNQRQTLQRVEQEWLPRLLALPAEERARATQLLRRHFKSPKLEEQVAALVERLGRASPT